MEQCLNGSDKYLQLRMLFAIHYLGLVFFVNIKPFKIKSYFVNSESAFLCFGEKKGLSEHDLIM